MILTAGAESDIDPFQSQIELVGYVPIRLESASKPGSGYIAECDVFQNLRVLPLTTIVIREESPHVFYDAILEALIVAGDRRIANGR